MRWRDVVQRAVATARLMVGVGDYEAYLAHRRAAHPGARAMTRDEFHRRALETRYDPGRGGRCC
jgi:uncharacterized short protein YbdD (DUF466 family)